MAREWRILRNAALLGGGELVGQIANFAFVVCFARAFGAESLGQYSLAMAAGAVGALFVSFGTHGHLAREASRRPEEIGPIVGALVPMHALFGLCAWVAAIGASLLLVGEGAAVAVAAAVCAYQILWRAGGLLLAPFRAMQRMRVPAMAEATHRILALALGGAAIAAGAGAGLASTALVASAAITLVFVWRRLASSFGAPGLRVDARRVRELLTLSSPYFGLMVVGVLYARGGMMMIGALADDHSAGQYAAADRTMVALMLVPGAFAAAAYPAIARLANASPAAAGALTARCLRWMLLGTVPAAALVALGAEPIVRLLFGGGYESGAAVLRVLAWTLPLHGGALLCGYRLLVLDRRAELARLRLAALAAFFCAGPALITAAGIVGLAWALVLVEALQFAGGAWLMRRGPLASSMPAASRAPGAPAHRGVS